MKETVWWLLLGATIIVTMMWILASPAEAEAEPTWFIVDLNAPALVVPAAWAESAGDVIQCESRWKADAVNKTSGATGLNQLMRVHERRANRLGFAWADMTDATANTLVAIDIWREQGFRPWVASSKCSGVQG